MIVDLKRDCIIVDDDDKGKPDPSSFRMVWRKFLDTIAKRAFDILETSADNREKLHAIELFKDTHLIRLELLSNAAT
jgi:hypothetical protein